MQYVPALRRVPAVLRLVIAASVIVTVLAPASGQTCSLCNTNLVKNGNAEDPNQRAVASLEIVDPASKPAGWTVTGPMQAARYDAYDFADDYGPKDRGNMYFYGGPGGDAASATQTVDLTAMKDLIDASSLKFYLSGYLGKIAGIPDPKNASITATFTGTDDAAKPITLVVKANGTTNEQTNRPGYLTLRTITGFVPKGMRAVGITLDLASYEGTVNSLAADNISLVLTTERMDGVNLVVNGDAETSWDENTPVAGWNSNTEFAVGKYGDWYGWPRYQNTTDPIPDNAGKYLFYCPTTYSTPMAFQIVDLTGKKDLIDAGSLKYDFSGWLGGYQSDPDTAKLTLTFFAEPAADGSKPVLGTVDLGPVTAADRQNQTGLWLCSAKGTVPVGTRSLQVTLTFNRLRTDPENISSFADSISLVLTIPATVSGVFNAASSQSGAVSPGEYVSIYGSSLGPATGLLSDTMLKGLNGVKVTFSGIEAFLTYVSAIQVNALVPYGVSGNADVVVSYGGMNSAKFGLSVTDSAPGIFTQQYGGGPAWVVNQDQTWNSDQNAASRGSTVAFFATGQGLVDPAGTDGETIASPNFPKPKLPVKVLFGSVQADDPVFDALIYTGVLQVNVRIPDNAPTGKISLQLKIGNATSRQDVTVVVK